MTGPNPINLAWQRAQSLVLQSGVPANAALADFLSDTETLIHFADASAADLTARYYQLQGLCSGLQGQEGFLPSAIPADGLQADWRSFLDRVRDGSISSRRNLSRQENACADAFLASAFSVFPDGRAMPAVKILGRSWGRKMSPKDRPLPWPVPETSLRYSKEMGEYAGVQMNEAYEVGLAGGLSKSVLRRFLHLRDVPDLLGAAGWLMGTVHCLRAQVDPLVQEAAQVLESNRGSVIYRTLMSGDRRYPSAVVSAIPPMLAAFQAAIEGAGDVEMKGLLESNRASVFNRALVVGDLGYPATVVKELPAVLSAFDGGVEKIADASVRNLLASNRGTVINRALHHGDLSYPALVATEGQAILSEFLADIGKIQDAAAKRKLESKSGRIIYLALISGDLASLRRPK